MLKRYRSAAIGCAALLASVALVKAAGIYQNYPIIGQPSSCISTVTGAGGLGGVTGQGQASTGSICAQTLPAGPPTETGEELIAADTGLTNPATVTMPSGLLGSLNLKKNKLIGGDFATNLWQRGTTPVNAASPTTAVIGADRWYAYSASTQVTVTKQTGTTDTLPTIGLYASMRVQRPSSQTGTGAICVGQVLDKIAAQDLIGKNGVLTFYALAGANFSASNSNVVATIAYYTAGDSATPLTNTATFATATTTGYTAVVAGGAIGTTPSIASGAATLPISTTWTRYGVYGPIPTATAAGTAVTGAGISICYTPVGTAGTNDWFEIEGVQLQAMPSTATAALPNGVVGATGFERRLPAEEAAYQYSYTSPGGLGTEVAQNFYMAGICRASGNANFPIIFNPPLRTAPTTATSTLTAGGYSIQTAAAITAIGAITISGASISNATLNSAAACTSTLPYNIVGTGTTGLLLFSAEP